MPPKAACYTETWPYCRTIGRHPLLTRISVLTLPDHEGLWQLLCCFCDCEFTPVHRRPLMAVRPCLPTTFISKWTRHTKNPKYKHRGNSKILRILRSCEFMIVRTHLSKNVVWFQVVRSRIFCRCTLYRCSVWAVLPLLKINPRTSVGEKTIT